MSTGTSGEISTGIDSAELEVLMRNGVIDTGYGSAKAERTVLLLAGEGAC